MVNTTLPAGVRKAPSEIGHISGSPRIRLRLPARVLSGFGDLDPQARSLTRLSNDASAQFEHAILDTVGSRAHLFPHGHARSGILVAATLHRRRRQRGSTVDPAGALGHPAALQPGDPIWSAMVSTPEDSPAH